MMGDRDTITEQDLTEEDLDALRFAVKQSQSNYEGRQKQQAEALRLYANEDPDKELSPGWTVGDELGMAMETQVKRPDRIDYEDYDKTRELAAPQGEDQLEKPWWQMLKNSYDNPTYRMQTTVGGAGYETDPEGNTIINDKYDWNTNSAQYDDMRKGSKWDYLREHAGNPVAIGDMLGSIMAPADDPKVRQTRINLGKLQK
jgi:hypothetical protein